MNINAKLKADPTNCSRGGKLDSWFIWEKQS